MVANCENCLKEKDCCSNGKMSGFCGGYNPVRVTNKERIEKKGYEEAAIMLSDFLSSIKDLDNIGFKVLEWLRSN